MAVKIEKVKQAEAAKRHQMKRVYKSAAIITCKRSRFNHHKGQTYSNFSPEHLASGGWKHYRSKGDFFTIHATTENPSFDSKSDDNESFSSLGLQPNIIKGLHAIGIDTPTAVQALAIPHMLQGRNLLCAAETGCGKTLAFLLPVLQHIEQARRRLGEHPEPNQPAAVILTPLRELADQIQHVAQSLSEHVRFHSTAVCGGRGTQRLLRSPEVASTDLLITTPGVFSKLLTNRIYSMARLHHLVLDEADTLFDDSFSDLTLRILRKTKIQSERPAEVVDGAGETVGTQVALVGATMPKHLESTLGDLVPLSSLETVTTPHLHRLQAHVPQKFLRLGSAEKTVALVTHLKKNPHSPCLVFCNKSETAFFLHKMLGENGVENTLLHSKMASKERDGRFADFQNGSANVLVCTDIVSRGLDTIRAQHVINYDFPHFMSDYIHRVGRVGRVSSLKKGFALNFVTHKWDVDLLWKIEAAARRVTELHNVNANIKRKLTGIIQRKFHQDEEALSPRI